MSQRRLLAAVRDQLRSRTPRKAQETRPAVAAPAQPRRAPAPAHDHELEQIEAEARYHRDRLDLYQARVQSGNAATSLGRLRELERTATAAADRLAHARRTRRAAGK